MIVEPAPTGPRSPLGRALRLLGLAAAPVLLLAVIGVGVLGPRPDPSPTAAPDASSAPEARPVPSEAPPVATGPLPAFPAVSADLAVLDVDAARDALPADRGPLAVAGYLSRVRGPGECPLALGDTRGTLSPLCERSARLLAAGPDADPRSHLHLRIPPGVRLPAAFEDAMEDGPVPVVVVGRAVPADDPGCEPGRGCHDRMTVDRVTWADGTPFEPGVVFDAGLEVPLAAIGYRHHDEAVTLATGWSGTVLVAAAVRPRTVGAIDPVAAARMALGQVPDGLVWYVRGLETAYDPTRYPLGYAPPRLSWAVVDHASGETLARGVDGGPDAFPTTVAGLPVLAVPEALAAVQGGAGSRVVAVAGWLRAWADPRACPDPVPGLPGGGCPRTAVLVAGPWPDDPPGLVPEGESAVIATVPPGVAIPDRAVGLPSADLGPPPPVVVIGRLTGAAAGSCAPGTTGCGPHLTIERVAWASGQRLVPGRQVAAGLMAGTEDPVADPAAAAVGAALPGTRVLLRQVLVPTTSLAAVDAEAEAAASASDHPAPAVWYLRGLDPGTGEVRWAVVEPGTGRIIASARAS